MQPALAQFRANIARARDLTGLASALSAQTTQALDGSDLLRAALVLAVSAFDHFIHEATRTGMIEIAAGQRAPTDSYYKFQVSLRRMTGNNFSSGNFAWLDEEIRERHGWLSFQDPNKLADALRNITDKELWKELGLRLDSSTSDTKARLRLIVDRRNKIAHEADMDPTAPGCRWPISTGIVTEAIDFLDDLAVAINDVTAI